MTKLIWPEFRDENGRVLGSSANSAPYGESEVDRLRNALLGILKHLPNQLNSYDGGQDVFLDGEAIEAIEKARAIVNEEGK